MFICLLRSYPFEKATLDDEMYKLLVNNDPKFWQLKANGTQISSKFKDLVSNMLQFRPSARLTIAEVVCHDWFSGQKISDEVFQERLREIMQQRAQEMKSRPSIVVSSSDESTQTGTGSASRTGSGDQLLDDEFDMIGCEQNVEGDNTIRFKHIERGGFDSVMVYNAIFENWDTFKSMIDKVP